jgi:hypothetical protein
MQKICIGGFLFGVLMGLAGLPLWAFLVLITVMGLTVLTVIGGQP